jgi:hypothetical protein
MESENGSRWRLTRYPEGVASPKLAWCSAALALAACAAVTSPPRVPADVEQQAEEYARQADRHFAAGERELALEFATHALVVRLAACGFECPEAAASFLQLGDMRQVNGQPEWAAQLYLRALEILEPHAQTHDAWIAALEQRLATVCSGAKPPPASCPRE